MIASQLISESIPPLKSTDTCEQAVLWMKEFSLSHLPVVQDQFYLGLIAENDILDFDRPELQLGETHFLMQQPMVSPFTHLYEVIRLMVEHQVSFIPVTENKHYTGGITLECLVRNMSEFLSINEPGGIITLQLLRKDYSMAEVARLVENNNSVILNSFVTSKPGSPQIELTLKINKTELTDIISTFERFEYEVKATFQESDYYDDLKDRYDEFMHFLDI